MAVQSTANQQTAQQIYSSQARQTAKLAAQQAQAQQKLYAQNAAAAQRAGARQGQINADTTAIAAAETQKPVPPVTNPTPETTADTGTDPSTPPVGDPRDDSVRTTTYIDQNGQKKTGVYSPAAGKDPSASVGMTGTEEAPSHWDEMRNLYQQMYDEQVAANNAANEAAAERAREAAQAQIDALNAGYQGTNRQLYRDYMENQRTLPQQMAALGYSGGLSESSQLRLRNAYEEGLNENERARLSQENAANAALAQQLYEAQAAATAANQQANQQRLGYLTALQEQQYQDQQQRAATLASAGDFSGYKALGYTDSEIGYLQNIWARQNPAMAYSLGKISAGDYYKLTGSYPPGYTAKKSSSGGTRTSSTQNTGSAFDYSRLGYSDQDVANALTQGRSVLESPLSYANALARAEEAARSRG